MHRYHQGHRVCLVSLYTLCILLRLETDGDYPIVSESSPVALLLEKVAREIVPLATPPLLHLIYNLFDLTDKLVDDGLLNLITLNLGEATFLISEIVIGWLLLLLVLSTGEVGIGRILLLVFVKELILIILIIGIIKVLVLILGTILIVEVSIPTRLMVAELGTPILGVFCNHLIATATTLGVLVVSRDSDHIGRIDLDDHGMSTTGIREVGKILDRTEVQSARASAILVLIDLITRHLTDLANGVVEGSRVNVLVVSTNILVGKEATIGSDGKLTRLKEVIKLIDGTMGRILHQVLKELAQGQEGQTLTHELHDAVGKRVVDRGVLEIDHTILDLNILGGIGIDGGSDVGEFDEGIPILSLDSLNDLGVVGMVRINRIGLSVDDCGDLSRSRDCDCCGGGVHSVCILQDEGLDCKNYFLRF
jgi:hypothetical protein